MKSLYIKAKKYLVVLLLLLWSGHMFGQVQTPEESIQIISRVQKDRVLLRWAANTPSAWKTTNASGFVLEKYVLARDGKRLQTLEKVWEKTIKADPLETWEELVNNNDDAAVIAQAIFGESFYVSGGKSTQLADIYNLSNEITQRFSFSLLTADANFEIAKKAGWGYEDTEVKQNEKYVYKIKGNTLSGGKFIKGTATIASTKEYEPLPKPIDLRGVFGDKNVVLTWEYALFKKIFTSYNLERSEDGVNFKPLSKEPIVNLNDKPNAPAKRIFYIDSLASNDKTYYYRVNGITSFGEKSDYSKVISGKGSPILPYTPRIIDVKLTKKANEAEIFWDFPKKGEAIIQKFQLLIAPKDEGPYKVEKDSIGVTNRRLIVSQLASSNYVKIKAVGKNPKQQKSSFSTLIQPVDTIPPDAPINLQGKIDSLGVVRVTWKQNEESDLLGYRIFRGFTKEEEPSQITETPFANNSFTDSVEIESLNSKVYYQVVAVDKRFNHSEKSVVLVLEKPDVIPPTAPVFSDYDVQEGKIQLKWIRSSEEGEVTHVLSRKNLTENSEWKTVLTTKDTIQQFEDTQLKGNHTYRYRIKAIDRSGLSSKPSSPLTIQAQSLEVLTGVKGLNYVVNRETNQIEIFWRADEKEISEYTLYKQLKEEKPSTWRVLPGAIKKVIDTEVSPNETYIYHVRASLLNGDFTKVKTIEVKF
ncbi:hypothetical protein [Tenacibaculum sp. M341]|uniref:hypothetical protein n=1 Tax=Tenacibaculum sp. M341 TaxID=2530339 RepID=UPI00104FB3D5|nr:hypothetical protein [Tenacibaculum sp. M341]TCI90121.1 hypothetical protein EYW44_14380 [Tenacibaculum sp. M341]